MTREQVYKLIDGEREYQNSKWPQDGRPDAPNPLTIGEFVLLIDAYMADAKNEWRNEKKPEMKTLDVIRKIGAIAVNCMEQHGAPERKL